MLLFPLCVLCVGSVAYLLFVRHLGGILAVANIRGGGEYGLTWHKGQRGTRNVNRAFTVVTASHGARLLLLCACSWFPGEQAELL